MNQPVDPEDRSGTEDAPYLTLEQARKLREKREAQKKPAKHRKDEKSK